MDSALDHSDDVAIVARIAAGDQDALAELYDRFHRPCYSFAVRMVGSEGEAEEVIQETFVRAWRHAARYEQERASVQGWLLSITRNLCIDELRRRRRRASEFSGLDDAPEPPAPDRTDIEAERSILREEVRGALRSLPPEQRSAIELVYFHGLTSQEVGDALHVPAPTVRSRLRLGLLKLAAVLQEKGVMSGV
jgi:RNA polymerase sigma-70 factor (ECF subfamily)